MNFKIELNNVFQEVKQFCLENTFFLAVFVTTAFSLFSVEYIVGNFTIKTFFVKHLLSLFTTLPRDLAYLIVWSSGVIFFYTALPLFVIKLFGRKVTDFGFNINHFKKHIGVYLILLMAALFLVFLATLRQDFIRYYPYYKKPISLQLFLIWEVFYALQFIGVEFLFRGFTVHGLKHKIGNIGAVIVPLIPYMMIHFGKPWIETASSIMGGALLCIFSLRTKSIIGGIFLHMSIAISTRLYCRL